MISLPEQQEERAHFLARVDGRIKLLVAFASLILVISSRGHLFPLFIMAVCLLISLLMQVSRRQLLLRLAEPLFISLVIVLLKTLFYGVEPLFPENTLPFSLPGYREGLREGLLIASRVMAAVLIMVAVSFSASFTEIIAGLSWFRIPRLMMEILTFAYRYIFVLIEDALIIYNSQKNRLGYHNITTGIRSFSTLVGALIIRSFEQSQQVTEAMIQRGYDGHIPLLKQKPLPPRQLLTAVLTVCLLLFIWRQ